jgi:hypothetical protein
MIFGFIPGKEISPQRTRRARRKMRGKKEKNGDSPLLASDFS